MVRASMVKVVSAFVAGLVIALASALLYVRVHDAKLRDDSAPIVSPAEVEQAPVPELDEKATAVQPLPAAPAAAEPDRPVEQPVPVVEAKKTTARTPSAASRPKMVKRSQPAPPIQVVQNTSDQAAMPVAQSTYPPISQPEPPTSQAQPAAEQASQQGPASQRREPNVVQLAAGTPVAIRLDETLSTEHNYVGDTFRGTLDKPIIRDGFVIAEKGSKVLGRIVDSTPAGRVRGVANLSVMLTEINTTDRQRVTVQTNSVEKRGTASSGSDAAKIAGGAALGAIIGALGGGGKGAAIGAGAGGAAGTGVVLATRGKAAVLPNESVLTFQLASPVTITEKLNN